MEARTVPRDDGKTRTAPGPDGSLALVQIVVLRHVEPRPQRALDGLVVRPHPELLQQDEVIIAASQEVPDLLHPLLLVLGAEGVRDPPGVVGHHSQTHHVFPVDIVAQEYQA